MNYKDFIHTNDVSASAEFSYRGTPEAGMLAWLDSKELQTWWKADSVIVEPFQGGMFYITWQEGESTRQHAIYGIMDKVDTDNNIIEITKIMYISPKVKMGHLHLHIRFESVGDGQTKLTIVHTHNYRGGHLLQMYNDAVFEAWPKTFSLFCKYVETRDMKFQ